MLLLLLLIANLLALGWFAYSLDSLLHFNEETKKWQSRDAEWDRQHLHSAA
jgi:hypothetical protein